MSQTVDLTDDNKRNNSNAIINVNFQKTRPLRLNLQSSTTFSYLTNRSVESFHLLCTNHTDSNFNYGFLAVKGTVVQNNSSSAPNKFTFANADVLDDSVLVFTLEPAGYFIVPIAIVDDNELEAKQDDLAALLQVQAHTLTTLDINRLLQTYLRTHPNLNSDKSQMITYLGANNTPVFVSNVPLPTRFASIPTGDAFPTGCIPTDAAATTFYVSNLQADSSAPGWYLSLPLEFNPQSLSRTHSSPSSPFLSLRSVFLLFATFVLSLLIVALLGPSLRRRTGTRVWIATAAVLTSLGSLLCFVTNLLRYDFKVSFASDGALFKTGVALTVFGCAMLVDYPLSGVSFWIWLKNFARTQRESQRQQATGYSFTSSSPASF